VQVRFYVHRVYEVRAMSTTTSM